MTTLLLLATLTMADVLTLIDQAASSAGINAAHLRRVVSCESSFNPHATSRYGHRGLLQYDRPTFLEQAPRYGLLADFDLAYDAESALWLGAQLLRDGQGWRWRGCGG